ncbi:MAG: hypothetical protein RSH78_03815, partial [Bacilli bacterium]
KMGYDPANPFIQMPQETIETANTKYGDLYWTEGITGKRVTIFGGSFKSRANGDAGMSRFSLAYLSSDYKDFSSSRLLKTAL